MTDFSERRPAATAIRRIWLAAIAVALLQTVILGYMIASRAAILIGGTEILLRMAPVDPRDLLRGDYVTLNYDVSRIPVSTLKDGLPAASAGHVLSVRLRKGADGFWAVGESSFAGLPPQDGTVVLKTLPLAYLPMAGDATMQVDYGIERYYVPEGEGQDIETGRAKDNVSVAVRVSSTGVAQIRSLLVDGRAVYDEPLY